MKKIVTFFVIVIAILGIIWYIYGEIKIKKSHQVNFNSYYEQLLNKEITGSDIASVINKTVDNNENNEVEKDKNGIYIPNRDNSVNIEIKFLDNDKNIKFEKIYENGLQKFIELYRDAYFRLTRIDYHVNTNLVKYVIFEEI